MFVNAVLLIIAMQKAIDKVDYFGHRRTAEEVHAMSLANLQGEYAVVVSTEEVLEKSLEKKS